MKLLAIETATEACSASLIVDDEQLVRETVAPRQHTRLILPMVDELLQETGISLSELDAIAFGRGPGAFTGVRIAVGVAQGLAFAHDLPVIPVSSLAALAQQQADKYQHVAVAIDARMDEVYWGLFERNNAGLMHGMGNELVIAPDKVPTTGENDWCGIGSGWSPYADQLKKVIRGKLTVIEENRYPLAREVATLAAGMYQNGETFSAEQAAPVYLRNKVVK